MVVAVGDPAPDLTLKASTGKKIALSTLWREQSCVLIFLRHFG